MVKKASFLFMLCFFQLAYCEAQNLVPDPSFEIYSNCPQGSNQLDYASSWFNPSLTSPDYFNACDTIGEVSTPYNWWGFQIPRTGAAYAGIIVYVNLFGYTNYRDT
jgi:hypothetical protein